MSDKNGYFSTTFARSSFVCGRENFLPLCSSTMTAMYAATASFFNSAVGSECGSASIIENRAQSTEKLIAGDSVKVERLTRPQPIAIRVLGTTDMEMHVEINPVEGANAKSGDV